MNDDTFDLDQTDEEILTYTVLDETLEAAAASGGRIRTVAMVGYCTGGWTAASGCC